MNMCIKQQMNISNIVAKLPDYTADIKKSITTLASSQKSNLEERQLYGIALTAAYYLKNEQLLNCVRKDAKIHLEEQDANACKLAVVYSALACKYSKVSGLQYNEVAHSMDPVNHKVSDIDFALYCFVSSSLRDAREASIYYAEMLKKHSLTKEDINVISLLIASLSAAAEAFNIESVRSYEFVARQSSL